MQVEHFEDRFLKLRYSALEDVIGKNIPVARFRRTLMVLPKAISKEHERYIIEKHPVFKQAVSVEDIFVHLRPLGH